jgi:hypothetical protein
LGEARKEGGRGVNTDYGMFHILLGTYFFPLLEKNLFQMTGRYTYIDIMFGKFIVFDFIAYLVGMSKQQI